MIIKPKWDKRNNKRKVDKTFKKRMDTNNPMIDSCAEKCWITPKARKRAEAEVPITKRVRNGAKGDDNQNE